MIDPVFGNILIAAITAFGFVWANRASKSKPTNSRSRALENYVYELREHIVSGKGAPPPPWPEELTRERENA